MNIIELPKTKKKDNNKDNDRNNIEIKESSDPIKY